MSVYSPRAGDNPYTIYQQQIQYCNEDSTEAENTDPLINYDNELTSLITRWMEDGDQVVVMIDSNVDLAVNKKGTFMHRLE